MALFGDDLPPFVQLFVYVNLDRADIGAGAAERRGKRQPAVFLQVYTGRKNGTNRSGYGGVVAVPATAPVDGAGIHAGPAADALQGVAEVGAAQLRGAAIVHDDDMHSAAFLRFVVVGGENR